MGTSLTGTKPKDTYDSLIKVGDNGPIGATAKTLSDGLGNDLPIAVSTSNVGIGTSAPVARLDVVAASTAVVLSLRSRSSNDFSIIEFRDNTGAELLADIYSQRTGVSSGQIIMSTSSAGVNTETLRLTPDKYVRLASGTGGIQFNGDTAAANALDDYEEGTFTPTVEGSSTAGTATYSVQIGKYTKIGNQISILIDLAWSGGTGTGILRIVGLPFTNVAFNTAGTIGFIDQIALTASNYATMYVAPSSTRLDFVQSPTGGGSVTDVSYDAAGRLIVSATYFNA